MSSKTDDMFFFKVSGLDCGSCAMRIETALGKVPGVRTVDASVTGEIVSVQHDDGVSMAALANKLDALGYGVSAMAEDRDGLLLKTPAPAASQAHDGHSHDDNEEEDDHDHAGHDHSHDDNTAWWRKPDGIIALSCVALIGASYLVGFASPLYQQITLITATLIGAAPIARKAWKGITQGFPFSIETLMVVAATGALALGTHEEAAVVVVLFLIGELLEGLAASRARSGIRSLIDLIPQTALIERSGVLTEVKVADLKIDDIILVRPGDRIPADGEILSGISSIDDSPVTGESAPKSKKPGDAVFAGSINHDATLSIRVSTDTGNNTITRIARLVGEAQDRKSPTQRFINRFSRVYTPFIFGLGLIVAMVPPLLFGGEWATWIYRGLAVLLIGCPCALVISTPAAIASGLASGARRGLLVKGGEVLEKLAKVTIVALDKTGTLTTGLPSVTDIQTFDLDENTMLAKAAAVEARSSHPLAKAVVAFAKIRGLALPGVEQADAVPGKGVSGIIEGQPVFIGSPKLAAEQASISTEQQAAIEALYNQGKTVAVVVIGGKISGVIGLRDEPKADAKAGLAALTRLNVQAVMLTGDHRATTEAIAHDLGIDARSELLPQDKMEIVAKLQADGQVVAKVGDGINDAPALAQANVGIAMAGGPGGGTDIALETGDAAILHGSVSDIANLITLARSTMGNIHQNLTIAIGLKAVFLVTTVLGITGLWPAIMADTGATLLVTANALRLLRAR